MRGYGKLHNGKTRAEALALSASNPLDLYFPTDAVSIITNGKEYGGNSLDVTALFTKGGTLTGVAPGEFGKYHMYISVGNGECVTVGNLVSAATYTVHLYVDMYLDVLQRRISRCTYDSSTRTWTCQSLSTKNL